MNHLTTKHRTRRSCLAASVTLLSCLALARPAIAEQTPASTTAELDTQALESFRGQYDVLMSSFEFLLGAQGNTEGQKRASDGREAMRALTDKDLARVFSRTQIPDLSGGLMAIHYVVSQKGVSKSPARAKPKLLPVLASLPSGCNGVAIDGDTLYALLIAKEVANSVLAAAAWVCNEDVLGENGSLACVPFAIAADVANGFFDTATFCAGMVQSNEVDAIWAGLQGIENDVTAATTTIDNNANVNTTTIVNNANANTATIVNNDNSNATTIVSVANANTATIVKNDNSNATTIVSVANANTATIVKNDNSNATTIVSVANANTATIVNNDNANTATIVNNDDANTATIVNNDNANTATIINNANANMNVLRDLILRTQIEQSLTVTDNGAQVALFELPTAKGGYLDLVTTIVTQTIANIQAAGGSVGNAASFLTAANAAKAAGQFKTAYFNYKLAYKAAGN
jgi:hypothetical protein